MTVRHSMRKRLAELTQFIVRRGLPGPGHARVEPEIALCNGCVVVYADRDVEADRITVSVAYDGRPPQPLPSSRRLPARSGSVFLYAIDEGLFYASTCLTVTLKAGFRRTRTRFEIGPGRYAGRCDGISSHALEGWVSPLFRTDAPSVRLLVDGVAGEDTPLTLYRQECAGGTAQGGWNGFRLPLPSHALDGATHRIAVQAGETVVPFGAWRSEPSWHIDVATPHRLAGWYYDRAMGDAPIPMRLVEDGRTLASSKTLFRVDLKRLFSRDAVAFDLRGFEVAGTATLYAGPEGSQIPLGRLTASTLETRVAARRAAARASLLVSGEPGDSREVRTAIRRELVEVERARTAPEVSFAPLGFAPLGEAAPAETAAIPDPAPRRREAMPPVCAIVPVYKGLSDLKLCLASLIPQLGGEDARAVVIDDASPDPAVGAYLAALAAEGHPGLRVLANASNLGFIGTVNRGFDLLEPGEDALVVNADTVLPPGLIDRLRGHCHAVPGVASVTPLSNNATILSFPGLAAANAPVCGLDAAGIDAHFAQEHAPPVPIPTAVGFCMYINRAALDEVGGFSPRWGKGYCEEVDWCLTARDLGWIHLAATDAFVVHEGSVSFGPAERSAILAINHALLEAMYPEYLPEIEDFIDEDPLEALRAKMLLTFLRGRFKDLTLQITHDLGGGTSRYVDDLCGLDRDADHEVAVLTPLLEGGRTRRLRLSLHRDGIALMLKSHHVESILIGLEASGVAVRAHLNSRLHLDSETLARLLARNRPYVMTAHDFQWYCPRVHLVDDRHFYCAEPPPGVCQVCVTSGISHDFADHAETIETDLGAWLAFNRGILEGAARIIAPSRDTAERYRRRFGLGNVVALPHPEPAPEGVPSDGRRPADPSGPLRIAVVGGIGWHKGYRLLLRTLERAARERAPLFLTVIGGTPDDARLVRHGNAEVTGAYRPAELRQRLAAANPDFVLLPSVWPETYSYVLSEVWDAGYGVLAFDFGAPAERIRAAGGGLLIRPTRDPAELLRALLAARGKLAPPPVRPAPAGRPTLEAYYRGALAAGPAGSVEGAGGRRATGP